MPEVDREETLRRQKRQALRIGFSGFFSGRQSFKQTLRQHLQILKKGQNLGDSSNNRRSSLRYNLPINTKGD